MFKDEGKTTQVRTIKGRTDNETQVKYTRRETRGRHETTHLLNLSTPTDCS